MLTPVTAPARSHEMSAELAAEVERAFAAGKRIVLTRNGTPVAAVVSLEDLRRLEAEQVTSRAPQTP